MAPVPTTAPAAPAPVAESGYAAPTLLGYVADPEVDESSGLVASRRNPGLYWTHNDSGDGPFLYCVQGHGEPCGTWRVAGANARDWEDIAAGPGPEPGQPYLYAADIGDNTQSYDDVVIYRVPEPAVAQSSTPSTKASPATTEAADALHLRYPDGPHDAEALLVHPRSGDVYIVVKEPSPTVYVARAPLSPSAPATMTAVGRLPIAGSLVTGGDISPDGRRAALCTYAEGYELRLPAGAATFDAIWQQTPERLALGLRPQGESIAYRLDGRALLTTSERASGLPDPLYQIEQQ